MSPFSSKTGRPLIIAFEGWNDAGDAASGAVRAIIENYGLEPGPGVDSEQYYDYQLNRPSVETNPDGTRRINWPTTTMYIPANAEGRIHALLGTEPSRSWPTFVATFLDEALAADVTGIIVLGAMLADVPHTRPIEVSRSSESASVRGLLGCERSQYEGPVGIPSVFAGFSEQVGIPSVSLWASVPHYVHHSPVPKVTLALLENLVEIAELDLDLTDWREDAREWEEGVNEMAEGDEDMTEYIHRLEEERDITGEAEEASAESIAEEFERFLRSTDEN
ncbi:MAG: hypothetical protein RLZ72_726 [Actinomycetota bacterium]|jgi:hypothetical protein